MPPPRPDRPHARFNGYVDVKTSKKICAVGEEYKALLRSALEDCASYYEGEISRIAGELMAEGVAEGSLVAAQELAEMWALQRAIAGLEEEASAISAWIVEEQHEKCRERDRMTRLLWGQQLARNKIREVSELVALEQTKCMAKVQELE